MKPSAPGSPFLTHIGWHEDRVQPGVHPFDIPVLRGGLSIDLTTPVTFLVGENGSGKSTLLEALAWAVGFGAKGGDRDHRSASDTDGHALGRAFSLSWGQRTTRGFFLHRETFHDFTSYLESAGSSIDRYGGTFSPIPYDDTPHFRLTRDFLNAPERFFRHLLDDGDE